MFCKYKDIFGAPGEGAHAYRLFDFAIVDIVVMLIAALLLSKTTKKEFIPTAFTLFLFGIIFHRLFCVRTTVDKLLFPDL